MPQPVVILRFNTADSSSAEPAVPPVIPVHDAGHARPGESPVSTLKAACADLPADATWVIPVESTTRLNADTQAEIQAAVDRADRTVGWIIAANSNAIPYCPWQVFPPRVAALIPPVGTPLIAAIRRDAVEQCRDVSQPLRDGLVRAAAANQVARTNGSPQTATGPLGNYPKLAPGAPPAGLRWLGEHLRNVSDTELFPQIASPADAVAFRAGLWQINDFLDTSHEHSQSVEGQGTHAAGDYWHAIMHRREPDPSNSKYWFRRVGRHPIFESLADRAAAILNESPQPGDRWRDKLMPGGEWDPIAFVDFCEDARRSGDRERARDAERIQWIEMLLLLAATHQDATGEPYPSASG